MRKSTLFIVLICLMTGCLATLLITGHWRIKSSGEALKTSKQELVSQLSLTDFSLWTEARYTRHPSQTDIFSPFGEFPSSLEHFPAGSLMVPVQNRITKDSKEGYAR
jgi:hypothetical protein